MLIIFSPFTFVLSAALPLNGFSKICQFLIDAVVVIVVFKVQWCVTGCDLGYLVTKLCHSLSWHTRTYLTSRLFKSFYSVTAFIMRKRE